MDIKKNIDSFLNYLKGTNCQLVAVSKTKPPELIMQAYNMGIKVFGENKVQELAEKHELLPKDIEWHMIGHLQRNKVKYIAPFVSLIHGVDSLRLLQEINKQGIKNNRKIDCLLQIHIAEEETKFGLSESELLELIESPTFKALENIRILGLMGMATNSNNDKKVRGEFKYLKSLFDKIGKDYASDKVIMQELSMGMSGDYKMAVEEGSTLIRVGSAIFGARNYTNN